MMEQPNTKPLYEADQVVTVYDMIAIRNGYIMQYQHIPFYDITKRFVLRAAVGVMNELLHWLYHGKPQDGIKCGGGHDAA